MASQRKAAMLGGGIALLTVGVALFGGSYVLEISGLRGAGIALFLIGLILMLASSRLQGSGSR